MLSSTATTTTNDENNSAFLQIMECASVVNIHGWMEIVS